MPTPQDDMVKSNEMRVLFIRSGRTTWDESGRVSGSADLPLSVGGVAEVDAEASRLAASSEAERLATVICGPDEASRSTAAAVAAAMDARIKVAEGLAEGCMGLWEGLRRAELEEKFPTAYRQWQDDPEAVSVPEGEPQEECTSRICGCLCRLLQKVSEGALPVAVVLRPGALRTVGRWLGSGVSPELGEVLAGRSMSGWQDIHRGLFQKRRSGTRAGV